MIEVNLLQVERQQRAGAAYSKADLTKTLIYMGFIAVVAAAALVDAGLYFKNSGLKANLVKIKRQRNEASHMAKLVEADRLQVELDKLNRKAVIIDDLITHRINWSKKLAALRDNLPSDVWIETIELEPTKGPKDILQTLRIEAATIHADRGFARSAETMESLRNSAEFMEGLTGELEDRKASNEPWDSNAQDIDPAQNVWRFSFVVKRQLPESERAPAPKATRPPAPQPEAGAKKK